MPLGQGVSLAEAETMRGTVMLPVLVGMFSASVLGLLMLWALRTHQRRDAVLRRLYMGH